MRQLIICPGGISMIRNLTKVIACICLFSMISACGGGPLSFLGPILSVSEIKNLSLDQFFTAQGLDDEYAEAGDFAVYIRDAVTGQDIACVSQDDGMEHVRYINTYYGGLSVRFREVQGEHPDSVARFQLVFVEQDSDGCPAPIASADDIIGITADVAAEDLIAGNLWTTNGMATAVLRVDDRDSEEPAPMASAMQDAVIVDQIGIENGDTGDEERVYYIFAERYEGDEIIETCQVDDDEMANVRYGNMIYVALNATFPCLSSDMADFAAIRVRLSIWVQKDNGPDEIGKTEIMRIGDLIGERAEFTNGKGYIRLRGVATAPFSARYARLEELSNLVVTDLEYTSAVAASETLEIHFMSPDGYSVVCAGPDQGLTGVDLPDTAYTGLDAKMTAVTGQRELFGWSELNVVVVGRSDSNTCPAPLSGDYAVLGSATALTTSALNTGTANLEEGGTVGWKYESVE
jgi:hypothetical protein